MTTKNTFATSTEVQIKLKSSICLLCSQNCSLVLVLTPLPAARGVGWRVFKRGSPLKLADFLTVWHSEFLPFTPLVSCCPVSAKAFSASVQCRDCKRRIMTTPKWLVAILPWCHKASLWPLLAAEPADDQQAAHDEPDVGLAWHDLVQKKCNTPK